MEENKNRIKNIVEWLLGQGKYFSLLLVALLGLTPLLWFQGKLITGEEFYSINYGTWGELYSNAWGAHINYGVQSMWVPFRFQGYFFNFLQWLGVEYYSALVFWHVLLWSATGTAFYLLINEIYKEKVSKPALAIATLFYVYNPFFINISVLLTPPRLLFILLPLELLVLFKYYVSETAHYRYIFIIAFLTFLFSPIYVNIPYASILFIPIIAFIVYKGLVFKKYFDVVKHLSFFGLLFLAMNAWWIAPTWWKTAPNTKDLQHVTSGFVTIDRSKVNDVISYFGSWAFREKAGDDFYFPYHLDFDNLPLALFRYIPFILILYITYLFSQNPDRSNQRKFLVFVLFLYWVGLFFAKGTSGTGGKIFDFIFKNFPGFWMYREPYAKFIPLAAVCGSILLPIALTELGNKFAKISATFRFVIYFIFVGLALYIGFPIWTSKVIPKTNNPFSRSPVVELPKYWDRIMSDWKVNDGYYLTFPSQAATETFLWPSGYSGSPFLLLKRAKVLATPNFLLTNNYVDNTLSLLYDYMINNPAKLIEVAPQYRVGGIIFQGDTSYGDTSIKQEFIRASYKDNLSIDADMVNIYTFENADSAVEIIPAQRIVNGSLTNSVGYRALKETLPAGSLINYVENASEADVYAILPDANNLATYNLATIKPGNYSMRLAGAAESFKALSIDGVPIDPANYMLKKDDVCCNQLTVEYPEIAMSPIPNIWQVYKPIDSENLVHYAILDDFDLNNVFNIEINLEEPLRTDTVVAIIQIDNDTDRSKNFGSGVMRSGNQKIAFTFSAAGALNTVLSPSYLLTLQPSENAPIKITSAGVAKIPYIPVVFEQLPDQPEVSGDAPRIINYEKITDSLMVAKIGEISNSSYYFQFKEGYDPKWRFVKINDSQLAALKSNILSRLVTAYAIGDKQKDGSHMNLEGYSNAWLLSDSEESYYALVYAPEYTVELLLFGSLLVSSSGFCYLLYSKFRRRKVKND